MEPTTTTTSTPDETTRMLGKSGPAGGRSSPKTDGLETEETPVTIGVRVARRRERKRQRRRRVGFTATIALMGAAIPVLGYAGLQAVLDSRGGRLVEATLEPGAPGYEALVAPTPVALVVHHEDNALIGLTALSLADPDGGGAVMLVPGETLTGEATAGFGFDRLRVAFEVAGADGVRQAVANVMNAGFSEMVEIDGARLAALVGPVAPLRFENPDDLRGEDADGEPIRFDDGPIELAADEVGTYLAFQKEGESGLARLVRHQLVLETWIAAVANAPDPATAVPGEGGTGLGHFVGRLAQGSVVYETLPVAEVEAPSDGSDAFEPLTDEIPAFVARLIPLPSAANPGTRVRVRVLDGIGDPLAVRAVIERLVPAGAQITMIGNADHFTYAATDVRFDTQTPREWAQQMRDALGVGEVTDTSFGTDAFDVTVIVGRDLVEHLEQGEGSTD
ncbi:MAG: LytR C-terminal domain-containing protein [Acidimicrobiales bacterium]